MKCNTVLLLGAALAPTASLALPTLSLPSWSGTVVAALAKRQGSLAALTDNYSFVLTLAQFTAKRNARDPPTLDWSSDGCSSSPDNPLGFPFVPACHHHDFGYRNFKAQTRFTAANKLRIDDRFREE
jgi:hypothetical protein